MALIFASDNLTQDKFTDVKVIGLQNTGTNLMDKFLKENFFIRHLTSGWKHHFIEPRYLQSHRQQYNKNVLKIVMVKHPMYWIQSIFKSGYEIKFADKFDINNMVRNSVLIKSKNDQIGFPNPCALWNMFYQLATTYSYSDSTIFVRYEDLLNNPEIIFEDLKTVLNPRVNTVRIIEKPAKNHGKSRDRKQSLSYYNNPYNMYGRFNMNNRRFIQSHVNNELIALFNYNWGY